MKSNIVSSAFILLVFLLYSCGKDLPVPDETKTPLEEGLSANEYISLSIDFFSQSKYDECIEAANKALLLKPDTAIGYYILSAAYDMQKNWEEGVKAGEKAFSIDKRLYDNLASAYNGMENWEAAKNVYTQALQADPGNESISENLELTEASLANKKISLVITIMLILLLVSLTFYTYKKSSNPAPIKSTFETVIISASVSCLLYFIFYALADFIHSFNLNVSPASVTPMLRNFIYERDGIEGYTLYIIMIASMLCSWALYYFISGIKNKNNYLLILVLLLAATSYYIATIKFFPPQEEIAEQAGGNLIMLLGGVLLIALGLSALARFNSKLGLWVASLILLPVCFITTSDISIHDYSYVFAPALRLIHGFSPSQIYFQYDLLLSLLAAGWMKMNIDLNLFQVVGQLSFFLFFIGAFWFSGKLFLEKKLSVYLLIALVIIRYYAVIDEPVALLQITPLRLDLWLILLIAVYFKGPYHWLVGLLLGTLIVLHKNFGTIYFISYAGLVLILALADAPLGKGKSAFMPWLKDQFLLNYKNVLILFSFLVVGIIVFNGFIPESAVLYQKLGVGMIPISRTSFYWYVPIIFGMAAVLLAKQRNFISPQYFSTGIFLLLLAAGNSLYFFGRSHENNILNISGALVLTAFMTLDLLNNIAGARPDVKQDLKSKKQDPKSKKAAAKKINDPVLMSNRIKKLIVPGLPIILILAATYFYSNRLENKFQRQSWGISHAQLRYPMPDVPKDFSAIKELTRNSPNVYFLNYLDDFMYYYYGKYTPVGYYCPLAAWPFEKDLTAFLQDLLNKHYYLVTNHPQDIYELLPKLSYNRLVDKGGFTAISKEDVPLLLPENNHSILHMGLSDGISQSGLIISPLQLKSPFTIELLMKPAASQKDFATLLSNMSGSIDHRGFILQQNNNLQNRYLFAFGNGKEWITSDVFSIEPDGWNYLAVVVTDNKMKIYNNGQLLTSKDITSFIKNTDVPLMVGNLADQNASFSGLIREIKITDGEVPDTEILKNAEVILPGLK